MHIRVREMTLAALLLGALSGTVAAQDLKETLFAEADAAFGAATEAEAELLAPRTYRRALKEYQAAENRFDRGGNLNRVRKDLSEAVALFKMALEGVSLARIELAALIKTREDALRAKADSHSPDDWRRVERVFLQASTELERGDLKLAQRSSAQAETHYRDLELRAIKSSYLDEIRHLLALAEKSRVKKYAPKTLQKAKNLTQQAEKELNENRYDTDLPRSLARQAKYEAQHAIYLSEVIRVARAERLTTEDVILNWETPIQQIAASADMVAGLEQGYEEPTAEIIAYIEELQKTQQSLHQDVNDRELQIVALEGEIHQLDQRLGGVSEERVALVKRLEAQAEVRERFQLVEKMFARREAQVFRESTEVYIRLVGLSFAVGQSSVDPVNFELLTRVQEAIDMFPRSNIVVEGHTDAYGSDASNMVLSQQRAESVRQYLLVNMRISPARLVSIGYGETQPVANNETQEGRAKNRRIDVRIRPNLEVASLN